MWGLEKAFQREEEATVENAETGHAKYLKNRRRLSCKGPQTKSKGLLLANYEPLFFSILLLKLKILIVCVYDHTRMPWQMYVRGQLAGVISLLLPHGAQGC